MVVYTPDLESEYGAVAVDIAEQRDEPLTEDVIAPDAGTVVYVAGPEQLDESEIVNLQRRLKTSSGGELGIITGRTPASARALYGRSNRDYGRHAMVFRNVDEDWFSYDDETEILCGEDATVERLATLAEEGLASLSLFTNGWPIHLFLSDGYLCGFPSDTREVSFEGNQPFCHRDGTRDCPLEGELLPADELDVAHPFVPACSSLVPNHPSGMPVHVGMGLLENAVSLIGTNRMGTFVPQEATLHYALLRAGYSVSHRCQVLNRNAERITGEPLRYLPFGRPTASLLDGNDEWELDTEAIQNGMRLELTDVDAHVIDVRLDGDYFDGNQIYARNRTEELANAPLYYTAFREDGVVRVLVYTWGRMTLDRFEIDVTDRPIRATERTTVVDAYQNAQRLDRLELLDRKASGQITDLGNQLGGIPKRLYPEEYDLNVHVDLADRFDRLVEVVDTITDRIVEGLDPGGAQTPTYHDRVEASAGDAGVEDCYCCGRPLYRKQLTDVTGTATREKGVCPRCGQIYDVPLHGDRREYPQLYGELLGIEERTHDLEMCFTNPRKIPMRATFVPYFMTTHDEYKGLDQFERRRVTETLAPGERTTVSFTLDLDDVPPNKHGFFGYVIGNLDLYVGLHPMVLGNTYGHVRTEALREDHPITDRYE